jgi:hypothetical protein
VERAVLTVDRCDGISLYGLNLHQKTINSRSRDVHRFLSVRGRSVQPAGPVFRHPSTRADDRPNPIRRGLCF